MKMKMDDIPSIFIFVSILQEENSTRDGQNKHCHNYGPDCLVRVIFQVSAAPIN